jgi:hypothetical protein
VYPAITDDGDAAYIEFEDNTQWLKTFLKIGSEAIHNEMDCLLKASWPETAADRQVRELQFMALIERRDAAARNLLQTNAQAIAPAGSTETLGQASLARQEASKNQAPQVPTQLQSGPPDCPHFRSDA